MNENISTEIQKEEVCAIFVTTNPPPKFQKRVELVLPQSEAVVIVDNNSKPEFRAQLQELSQNPKINVIYNAANLGIAASMNKGFSWAIENEFKWALTLDDDTYVSPNLITTLSDCFSQIPNNKLVAIIASNFQNSDFNEFLGNYRKTTDIWFEQRVVITSGSLTRLNIINKIGFLRENFFLDAVDHEFCLRARKNGYKIIFYKIPLMNHTLGNVTLHRHPFLTNKKVFVENHSAGRKYFMYRNSLIVFRNYLFFDPAWSIREFYNLVVKFIKVLLYETDKFKKAKYIFLGVWDGLRNDTSRNSEIVNQKVI